MASRYAKFSLSIVCAVLVALAMPAVTFAQTGNGGGQGNNQGGNFFFGVVGGVSVNADKVLTGDMEKLSDDVRQRLLEGLSQADSDINDETKLRMISLKGLQAAMAQAIDNGQPLSSEVQFMAGLQRIEFVIASPETNDIILAGPGEGWELNENGVVVGKTSKTPVLHLEDFLTAMRSVDNAREGRGISVSIDPTEAGVRQLSELYSQVSFNPNMAGKVEEAFGPQTISLTGIDKGSRFSQVLVAADYKMKRFAMGLDAAPLRKLPSVLEMVKKQNARISASPRMWMECNYEPMAKNEEGTVWQIRGQGVRTLTEETKFNADGSAAQTGKKNKFAENWASSMTKNFEDLSKKEPVFRDLRNLMDFSVVAAIIKNENLAGTAGLDLSMIQGAESPVSTPSYAVPEQVPAQCSFVFSGNGYNVTVSGGIVVDSWGVAENNVVDNDVNKVAATAMAKTSDRWWWNAK
jgi:hypothetical protein